MTVGTKTKGARDDNFRSGPVIEAHRLGKQYRLGETAPYSRFSEILVHAAQAPLRFLIRSPRKGNDLGPGHGSPDRLWALREISFEVRPGEVLGIIGRNGAGKSTLLKILSQITEPSEGEALIRGRVGSLLEVGTGFHPELTGRENIFLNGAILGMTKHEVRSRFDEIVDFSGVERFLETPVKRYSDGMRVRLAFAVAAHLNPEILLIDEVLAVGDAEFQKRCMDKMGQVTRGGRTILFVSHNMAAVSALCDRCLLLEEGRITHDGPTQAVLATYFHQEDSRSAEIDFSRMVQMPGDNEARLLRARVTNGQESTNSIQISEPVWVEMEYELLHNGMAVYPNFHFLDSEGRYVFVSSDSSLDPDSSLKNTRGRYLARCRIPPNLLNDTTYFIGLALTSPARKTVHFFEKGALLVRVVDPIQGTLTRPVNYAGRIPGTLRPYLEWDCERLP